MSEIKTICRQIPLHKRARTAQSSFPDQTNQVFRVFTQHIFYNCEYAKTLWQHIHNTTKKLVPDLDLSYENIVLGKDLDTKEVKQRLTKHLIDTGKKTIWCFRNMYFHDDPIKAKCIKSLFRCNLQFYIERDFYISNAAGIKPTDFCWQFKDIICSITDNKIKLNI